MLDSAGKKPVDFHGIPDVNDTVVPVVKDDRRGETADPAPDCRCKEPEKIREYFDVSRRMGDIRRRNRGSQRKADQTEPVGVAIRATGELPNRRGECGDVGIRCDIVQMSAVVDVVLWDRSQIAEVGEALREAPDLGTIVLS